jgi:hypothetical protein
MDTETKQFILKLCIFVLVVVVIGVLIYFVKKGLFKSKRESFLASDSYGSDFDYIISFIKNISGL